MNQLLIYSLIAIGGLLVALMIPGVKVIAEMVLKGLVELMGNLLKHKSSFLIWAVKTLISDHVRLFEHAIQARDTIDPTQKIRRKVMGYDDDEESSPPR